MPQSGICPIAAPIARRMRDSRDALTQAWLDRIAARVSIDPNRIFPTEALLDHVPLLIVGIADHVENPAEEITADTPVVAKAMELGALRHEQGFDAYQILKEYELLGGVLFSSMRDWLDEIEFDGDPRDVVQCTQRLFRAVSLVTQMTTAHFMRVAGERVREREERLRGFNRMVSHELKNRVGAIQGANTLMKEDWLDDAQRAKFTELIGENAEGIRVLLENLTTLSRLDDDTRQQRNVLLPQAVREAVRQLREFARGRGVAVKIQPDLPAVEVNAAAVELCLTNYISNAIKYSDPRAADRTVWIDACLKRRQAEPGTPAGGESGAELRELVVSVRDNGLGVPAAAREKLFSRFFRAHETDASGVEGTGLGLSIVRDTMKTLGGHVWAEFPESGGSVFNFAIPARRTSDPDSATQREAEARSEAGT
jgi:signal transduction histidine kinase